MAGAAKAVAAVAPRTLRVRKFLRCIVMGLLLAPMYWICPWVGVSQYSYEFTQDWAPKQWVVRDCWGAKLGSPKQ